MNDRAERRVGVNLLWLVPGEVGGSEEYTVRLLLELAELRPDDVEVFLYVNRQFSAAHPELVTRFTTRVAPVSGSSRILRVFTESTWLAVRSLSDRCTVLHHCGGTMPFLRLIPGVLTLHDLQPLTNPDRFGFVKGSYIRFIAPRSLRRARTVVCLSEFVANDVVNRVGIERERIRMIPCGINEPDVAFDHDRQARLLERLGLTERPFIVYPAITYPHKNHETLIAAFAQIVSTRPELRLVFTGGSGSSDATVAAAITAYGLTNDVVRTGRIPEADLDLLFRAATVVAFPSLYEGFGIPVLEAMSRGCPVVASNVGALPEVIGGAGELVNPLDVVGWANALGDLIDDPARRTVLARQGFDRAKDFDWSTPAQSLLSLYRETR